MGVSPFLEVALLQQTRLHLVGIAQVGEGLEPARLQILHDQKRSVGPPAHIKIVVELLLDDDIEPRERHRAVGAGSKSEVDVGVGAEIGRARVDHDMVVSRFRDIDRHAPGIVVVGNLRRAAPLHIHPGMLDNGLPGKGHLADHHGRHMARALADLERRDVVRRVEQLAKCHGAGHAPHTARSQHGEQRFPTVALFDIVELLAHGRECLVPCDAHPARVLTLGIGSLHGIAKAIRVIRRLQRRLRFRATVRH